MNAGENIGCSNCCIVGMEKERENPLFYFIWPQLYGNVSMFLIFLAYFLFCSFI